MKHTLLSSLVFTALMAGTGVLRAADTVATDSLAQPSATSTTSPASAVGTAPVLAGTTAGTGTTATDVSVRRPLSQALSSNEKNLEKNPDSKGLLNARERLLRNQAKIEERRAARQGNVEAVETDDDTALTRQQRFDAKQAKREEHFERKQEKREAHFERKQLERTAKAERPEKVERAEKVERPEKVERAEKVERPEKQGR